MFSDLRYAFRQLLKSPGFTTGVVLTLALGIGATTSIYSVVNSALLNPVPGPDSERLMQIAQQNKETQQGGFFIGVCPPVLHAIRGHEDFLGDVAWTDPFLSVSRKTGGFTEMLSGAGVSPNFFALWNVRPILGRTFAPDEAAPSDKNGKLLAGSVIVISYSL